MVPHSEHADGGPVYGVIDKYFAPNGEFEYNLVLLLEY
jgi:hypothetical protein